MPDLIRRHVPLPAALLFILAMSLVALSIVMVYSTTNFNDARLYHNEFYHFKRQAVGAAMGLFCLIAASRIDYQKLAKAAKPLMWFSFVLLLLCYVPHVGRTVKGQSRWIHLVGVTFQPSELAKLAMVIFMADTLTKRKDQLRSFTLGFLPAAVITGAFLFAIVAEQDLGATFVLGVIIWLMWFVAGMRLTHLLSLLVAAIPAIIVFVMSSKWRLMRLIAFLNPEQYRQGAGLQLDQSLIAIGSGGIFGRGLGEGLQKYHFLPEGHTDFIFAHIGEELGLIGCLLVLLVFVTIAMIGISTTMRMPDLFGSLLAFGLTLMLTFPTLINLAVVTGLLPTKGLALPLISFGRSQLLVNMAAVGILINIVHHRQRIVDGRRRQKT